MKPFMVGLCGGVLGAGVGKTEAALALVESLSFVLMRFSARIESMAASYCEWDGQYDRGGLEVLDAICRKGRNIDENYWLNMTASDVAKSGENFVVFDDVYFRNEAKFIQESGGCVICIVRDGCSDDPLRDFEPDHVIENNDNLNVLRSKIVDYVSKIIYDPTKSVSV